MWEEFVQYFYFSKKSFIHLKSRFFSAEEGEFWFVVCISTHIFPVIFFDVWEIGEQEKMVCS